MTSRDATRGHRGEEAAGELDFADTGHDRREHLHDRRMVRVLRVTQEGDLLGRLQRARGEDGRICTLQRDARQGAREHLRDRERQAIDTDPTRAREAIHEGGGRPSRVPR